MTTNMSGSGEYFTPPALAMRFVPVVEVRKPFVNKQYPAERKGILNDHQQEQSERLIARSLSKTGTDEDRIETSRKENLEVTHIYSGSDNMMYARLLTGDCRMDGDDTLMSSEERILIISKRKHYPASHPGEAVYH